jgi:polysaccharide pyruvyl transferase WcaK-like protein
MGLVKKYLRQLPWLRNALAAAKRAGREVKSLLLSLPGEIRHLWRMRSLLVESDLLVMSGGGQIDDYWGGAAGHPYALFKWAMLARLCGTPVVFLSVGVCTVGTPLGRRLAHSALRLAAYRSYRDHGSKALLRAAAFTQSDPEFPDLAFSHPCAKRNPAAARIANASCAVVGISPIAFLRPQVWPESDPGVYEQYLQTLCNFTARVLAGGHPVVIFTTASMDRPAAKDLEARLRQRPESKSWNGRLRRIDQQRLERQLDEIGKMDLVVASRLHGVILSHLLSRPVLAISYDRKVRAHMESMTQERHCLNLRDCTVPQLCDGFDRIESDAVAIAANIRSRVEEFGQRLDRQYDRLVQTLLVK